VTALVEWGVRVEGSSVVVVRDGLSAFREEAVRRAYGDASAQACYRVLGPGCGEGWFLVDWDSTLRPGPVPPPVAPWWAEVLFRWGRNRLRFKRRRA
jgi:hypothetical protein